MKAKIKKLSPIKHSDLNDLYVSQAVKSLAFSFTQVFAPIFLLKLGYSFRAVLGFFVFEALFRVLMNQLTVRLIVWFGARPILATSYFIGFAYSCLFAILPQYHMPIILLAAVSAVFQDLHWVSFHLSFSRASTSGKASKQAGVMDIIFSVASAIGPLAGGFIAAKIGINALFYISPVILLFGIKPLFRTHEAKKKYKLNYRDLPKNMRRDQLSMVGWGTEVGSTVLWPLYIYTVVAAYQSVGAIMAISVGIGIVTTLLVGKMADKGGSVLAIKVGALGAMATHAARIAASNFAGITIAGISGGFSRTLLGVPYSGQFYRHASTKRSLEYLSVMEFTCNVVRLAYYLVLLAATYYLPMNSVLVLGFALAAMVVPLAVNMNADNNIRRRFRKLKALNIRTILMENIKGAF